MSQILITDEFKEALDIMQNPRENCLFISGKAGTGKSTLLKEFISRKTNKKFAILAPTGIAAMNVRGSTIHSFFKFPPLYLGDIQSFYRKAPTLKVLRNLEMLIIDEISMVRVDLMDAIDRSLRQNRNENIPFGGVQIIFIGDLLQLPPVVGPEEKTKIKKQFSGEFFFDAPVMKEIQFKFVSLERIFRQDKKENDFKEALNRIREKKHINEDLHLINKNILPLKKRLSWWKKIIAFLYKVFSLGKNDLFEKWSVVNENNIMKISPKNREVYDINRKNYVQLNSKEYIFKAVITGKLKEDSFEWDKMTEQEQFLNLKNIVPAPYILKVKEGAKIMMTNNDPNKRWVNGSLGEIIKITDEYLTVNLSGRIYELQKEKFETAKYEWNDVIRDIEKKIESTYTQFPIQLAWAITIHKSQGLSFDKMILENSSKMFADGQLYVALSRCRRLDTLYIRKPISSEEVMANERVIRFYKSLSKMGGKIKSISVF